MDPVSILRENKQLQQYGQQIHDMISDGRHLHVDMRSYIHDLVRDFDVQIPCAEREQSLLTNTNLVNLLLRLVSEVQIAKDLGYDTKFVEISCTRRYATYAYNGSGFGRNWNDYTVDVLYNKIRRFQGDRQWFIAEPKAPDDDPLTQIIKRYVSEWDAVSKYGFSSKRAIEWVADPKPTPTPPAAPTSHSSDSSGVTIVDFGLYPKEYEPSGGYMDPYYWDWSLELTAVCEGAFGAPHKRLRPKPAFSAFSAFSASDEVT